jgi:NTE family protein
MKLGLVFSGGGSRGAYQVGVCMALKEAGILEKVNAYSGTSIGSVNATMIASVGVEKLKEIWFDLDGDVLVQTENLFNRIRKEKMKYIDNGIYSIAKLEEELKNNMDIDELRKKEVYVTLSLAGEQESGFPALLKTSFEHYLKHDNHVIYSLISKEADENIFKQVIASCSIPVVFSPMNIEGKQYYDGGLYDNVPVKPLVDAGCDTIIVIHLDKLPYFYKHKYPEVTFIPIKPRHSLGWLLNFNRQNSELRYHQGYEDTMYMLKNNQIIL